MRWVMISYTSMWYWLTLARMEMFSRTYLKRTWWSDWHCTFENELGIIPVGIPWSLNTFYSIWLFVQNELIRISCNALAGICSWPMRKINMLHEKIVRLGTSFQMVKDIFFGFPNKIPYLFFLNAMRIPLCYLQLATRRLLWEIIRSNSFSMWARIVWWGLFFEDNQLPIAAAAAFELPWYI